MSKDERFLALAMGVALTSKCRFKHGCVIVKHGHILGVSPNIMRNNPRNVDHKHCSIHAEISAMRKAGWPIRATAYVARINGQGEPRLSKPCANCEIVLEEFKIKSIWTE